MTPHMFTPDASCPDLWHYLSREAGKGRPILLYGMGNGADKILAVCAARGIPVADTFASDGFVRGHLFHGRRVLSFSEARQTYGEEKMIVLLSFGSSRPDVLETIRAAASLCELYIPDMPVSGEELFTADLVSENAARVAAARELFADGASRAVFDGILTAKLSGRLDQLDATVSPRGETWRILKPERFTTAMDLGAYTGDSLRELMTVTASVTASASAASSVSASSSAAPGLKTALCMEPDARTFRKLDAFCREQTDAGRLTATALNVGAWSQSTTLTFHGSGNRNASLVNGVQSKEKVTEVPVTSPDEAWMTAFPDVKIDFIKYDVEGAERQALLGSKELIARDAPTLLVSAYHAATDLWELPLLIHELNPAYKLYLRRMAGVPAWDIEVYAGVDL